MPVRRISMMAVALNLVATSLAAGQTTRGFLLVNVISEGSYLGPGIGGGFLTGPHTGDAGVAVGAQGAVFFSRGYAVPRFGPLLQANLATPRAVKPFAIGGVDLGMLGGPFVGGGVEFHSSATGALRASVQVYIESTGGRTTFHPTFQFGIVSR